MKTNVKYFSVLTLFLIVLGLALQAPPAMGDTITVTNASGGVTTITNPVTGLYDALPKSVQTGLDYLAANTNATLATNWTAFVAYTKVTGAKSPDGGTFGLVYYLNPYIGTQIRMQYINTGKEKFFLPNGTVTLQSAYQPIQALPIVLRPLVEAGVAVDFSGNLYAIVGAGSELDLWVSKKPATTIQRISLFYGVEQWQGSGHKYGLTQYGAAVNLNLGSAIVGVETWMTSLFSKL